MSIGGHGRELVKIVVSETSEGRQHSENFMGCTVISIIYHCHKSCELIDYKLFDNLKSISENMLGIP